MEAVIEKQESAGLNTQYQKILNQWTASKKAVHDESIASYGNIEKYMALIPIFFKAATLLFYFLAFKILGISIHALQVFKVVSTTTVERLPFIDWLGLYPTWETTLTQLLLLLVIATITIVVRKSDGKQIITTNV